MNNRLRELRSALKLTQDEFAIKLGVTRGAIAKLEIGDRNLTNQMIKSICREYNVSEYWLRTGEGNIFNEPDIMIIEKIDYILSGENEFRKNLLKTIVDFNDDELLLLEKIIKKLTEKKAD